MRLDRAVSRVSTATPTFAFPWAMPPMHKGVPKSGSSPETELTKGPEDTMVIVERQALLDHARRLRR